MIKANGIIITPTIFPDNTSQIWKLPKSLLNNNVVELIWEFSNEGEFMQIAQLKHLLSEYNSSVTLRLKYLPYGRQDKEVSNESTFALQTFASLLNILMFDQVIIHDPHSQVALNLIRNSKARDGKNS